MIQFGGISFVTKDVLKLRAFYENVFGGKAEGDENHSVMKIDGTNFVFLAQKNPSFYFEFSNGGSNTILSFNADDVNEEYQRLLQEGAEMLNEPVTHPWGARSFQFKDPDGNILNFISPNSV